MIKNGELFLIGTHISPLPEASTTSTPTLCARQAPFAQRRNQQADRQGGTARLHARAAEFSLQGRPRQMRDRPRQEQEDARQARNREKARLGARKGAFDALADLSRGRAFAATLPEQRLPST